MRNFFRDSTSSQVWKFGGGRGGDRLMRIEEMGSTISEGGAAPVRARGVAVPTTRPHASGRPLLWICWQKTCSSGWMKGERERIGNDKCVGQDARKRHNLFQGLPPPDPRFLPRGCRPRTPTSFPGLPPRTPLLSADSFHQMIR